MTTNIIPVPAGTVGGIPEQTGVHPDEAIVQPPKETSSFQLGASVRAFTFGWSLGIFGSVPLPHGLDIRFGPRYGSTRPGGDRSYTEERYHRDCLEEIYDPPPCELEEGHHRCVRYGEPYKKEFAQFSQYPWYSLLEGMIALGYQMPVPNSERLSLRASLEATAGAALPDLDRSYDEGIFPSSVNKKLSWPNEFTASLGILGGVAFQLNHNIALGVDVGTGARYLNDKVRAELMAQTALIYDF